MLGRIFLNSRKEWRKEWRKDGVFLWVVEELTFLINILEKLFIWMNFNKHPLWFKKWWKAILWIMYFKTNSKKLCTLCSVIFCLRIRMQRYRSKISYALHRFNELVLYQKNYCWNFGRWRLFFLQFFVLFKIWKLEKEWVNVKKSRIKKLCFQNSPYKSSKFL